MLLKVFSSGIGINNKVPVHRIAYDAKSGVGGFEDASNVLVGASGNIVTRNGREEISADSFHSLFSAGTWGLVVKDRITDAALYKIIVSDNGVAELIGLRSELTKGAKFDYCNANGVIHYTNGYQNGIISLNGFSAAWPSHEWPDEDTRTNFMPVPAAKHLCFNYGRIIFSIGALLNYTEFGMLGLYDPARNGENFKSNILGIAAVDNGLYVSDQENIYYIDGRNPSEWDVKQVTEYPALEWGVYKDQVSPSDFGFDSNSPAVIIATVKGPLLCMSGGITIDLISKNVRMPECKRAAALAVFDETLIIQTGE